MKKSQLWPKNIWSSFGFDGLDAEEFKKRTTAVQLAIFTASQGTIYCLIYVFLGFPSIVYVIYAYVLVCVLNLLYLRFSHNFSVFGVVQLALIFLFPLAAQIVIGGFNEASGVALAIFLAPAGALLYARRSIARICFYLFVIEIIGAAVWEYYYGHPVPILPRAVILIFFVITFSFTFSIIYFLLESFLQKQEELRTELRQSIETLRTTQKQLIQSEKMASLGELTAGIAHEIQNPLNFVNNFSDVSVELIDELMEELQNPDRDSELEASLLTDMKHNLQKINHHGGRASSIVRGMLEHSRVSDGQRGPTDLNALTEEYLRLAYHGLRAKDKTFNATLKTDFDPSLGLVNIASQDIGRVLLNLFTNGFYAVQQRQKQLEANKYHPTVSVSTRRSGKQVVVTIHDNGVGIPESVQQKIFQPFFTTKPTGEGTGLGLSLAYDIITKGHNGTLVVESREGEGSKFILTLPA